MPSIWLFHAITVHRDIVPAKLIEAVGDYTELENGFYRHATGTHGRCVGNFNFKNLSLNFRRDSSLELGPKELQTITFTRHRYEVFRNALSADGTWELKARPGTNGDAPNNEQTSGILINVVVDDVIKHKIYWKIVHPVAAIPQEVFKGI